MGGVTTVQGEPDPFNTYSNPAMLGELHVATVSVGVLYMDPRLSSFGRLVLDSTGVQGDFHGSGVLPGLGNTLGLAFPVGPKSHPLTVGAAFYVPSGSLVRVSGDPVDWPFYPLYKDLSRNAFFIVGAGYRIWGPLHAGVNFSSTTESVAIYKLRADNTINYSSSIVEARTRTKLSFALLYDFALKQENPHNFSLVAMYRAASALETKLAADISSFVPVQGELVSTPSYSPAEWLLGWSAKLNEHITLSADGAWVEWNKYSSPYGTGNINSYVIGSRYQGAGFKNIFVPHVGVQYKQVSDGSIRVYNYRGGVLYHPSPVPPQTGDTNFVDSDRWAFTGGFGLGIKNPWARDEGALISFDSFFQWNYLKKRQITKPQSTSIGAPGYLAGGKILNYGLNATLDF